MAINAVKTRDSTCRLVWCRRKGFKIMKPATRESRKRGGNTSFTALLAVTILVLIGCSSSLVENPPQTAPPDTDGGSETATSTEPGTDADETTETTPPETTTTVPVPSEVDDNGFNDHTVSAIASIDEYFALAKADDGGGQSVAKFTITDLSGENAEERNVRWLDSNFYSLHDEYSWFRLLNGQPVPGFSTEPVQGESFETIAEIYEWAETESDLPLDLRFIGERLYSNNFYDVALFDDDKQLGLGSLINYPPNELSDVDRWVMELEFSEETTPESVEQFFVALQDTLPAEIADELLWVLRSPHQRGTADEMVAGDLPFADSIVQYRDIVPAGQVEVYNEGIAAGRLRVVGPDGININNTSDTDILIMEDVPDWLPPGSALLTSSPQTPLAHVNLLARNRGIPNASLSGLLNDPAILRAAVIGSHAVVRASGSGDLDITLITREEFNQWQQSRELDPISVPDITFDDVPITIDLNELAADLTTASGPDGLTETSIDAWRPVIGGKAAGFLSLINADGVTTPDGPLAVTIELYDRHLALHQEQLDEMLSNTEFQQSSRVRFLLLEGGDDFADEYQTDEDAEFHELFVQRYAGNESITAILEADGFKKLLRETPMDADDLAALNAALTENFATYADTQGLRFRSSSSVEDIEGFSGAGLYDSNTGFFDPTVLEDEDDHDRTVERAIKKTWASYWGFEAYEERRRENVDHLSGAMAVLVHARFDDELEINNGVATVTLTDPASGDGDALVVINTQQGDVSVTNPDPDDVELPEVIEVTIGGGQNSIERLATSTLSPDAELLDDAAVDELTEQLLAVTELWRTQVNADLTNDQDVTTVTLDFEFKTMAPGWPAVANESSPAPGRLVIKQARSLDPGLRGIPAEALDAPIPRDVLARAATIERFDCAADGIGWSVLTNPLLPPDLGYAESPLVTRQVDESCTAATVLTTSDQLLIDLLASGTGLDLAASS